MIDIILQRISKIVEHHPQMKSGGELRCSGRVSYSTSISGDSPDTLYITRSQVMTSTNGTNTKIKRTKIGTIQA
jgi:hypothetical protein